MKTSSRSDTGSGTPIPLAVQANAAAVANAIMTALALHTDDTGATGDLRNADLTGTNVAVLMTSDTGETFSKITGGATMVATNVWDFTDSAGVVLASTVAIGTCGSPLPAQFKGIDGGLICLQATFTVNAESGAIAGSAHFVPTDADALWVKANSKSYRAFTEVAAYGHWLDGDPSAIVRHVSTRLALTGADAVLFADADATADNRTTASYSGQAGGFSHRTAGEGSAALSASGEFVADVKLKATFTATASDSTLGGTITNFAEKPDTVGTAHFDPNWAVRAA